MILFTRGPDGDEWAATAGAVLAVITLVVLVVLIIRATSGKDGHR